MERSDRPETDAADAAAPKTEPPRKTEGSAQVPAEYKPAPAEEGAQLPVVDPQEGARERLHFEALDRETTQPVRRYQLAAPHEAADIQPTEPEPPDVAVAQYLEPWPDPVETTRPPEPESWPQVASAPPASDEVPSTPAAFEPHPFAVPAPRLDRPQYVLPVEEARAPEPEPGPAPDPEPASLAPAVSEPVAAPEAPLRHDAAEAWNAPSHARIEPRFEHVEPTPAGADPTAYPAAESVPAQPRDWRDLARRAAAVAFLMFGGWLIAVLMLIAAYRFINPPFSMLMALQWASGTSIRQQWVPIERISPNLTRAVVVAEDGRFCQHWGVDFIEAARAIQRASDGYPRGASTITMQVAKNLFLVPTKSYVRKMVEIPLTFAIELAWPKRRILEIYLNIVEWGPGIFGAEAASQAHFGRPAIGLSPRQAAQLAVSLPNPIVRDAGDPGPRTARRASTIQARAAGTRGATSCIEGRR